MNDGDPPAPGKHDRDQPKVLWGVQIACLVTMIALAWIDATSPNFTVTPQWLLILAGIALGPEFAKFTHRKD